MHWWFVARRIIMPDVLEAVLPADITPVVLDLGCGIGGNIGGLAETHGRYECCGLEYDPDATTYAPRPIPPAAPSVGPRSTARPGRPRPRRGQPGRPARGPAARAPAPHRLERAAVLPGVQNSIPGLADRGTTGDMSVPPPLVNGPLIRLFAGESRRVFGSIGGASAYERGVSLLAVYRRVP